LNITGTGSNVDSGEDGEGMGEEEEMEEERVKVEEAFDSLDLSGRGWIKEDEFETLMTAAGTTYSREDHGPKLSALCKESRLHKVDFVKWYL
ncbi:unnamed protein product, partial [Discosporangium mesarthrocarpum]